MRNIFLYLLIFLSSSLFAQGLGIQFQATSWDQAVEMAQEENKIIFLDAYTTWCAPCKVMDEYVFTHQLGGDLYNPNFINLKMDMEKEIGPLLASRYGITSYPTFLFLAWDGTLIYKSVGYQNIEKFVSEGRKALEPYRYERAMNERFEGGDRIPDFLYHLTSFRMEKNDMSYKELIPLYLESQPDWNKPQAMSFIFDHVDNLDSDMFKHMATNKVAYGEVVGEQAFNDKFNGFIKDALNNNDQPISLERRETIYKLAYPSVADQMMTEYKLDYYTDNGDEAKYAETAFYYYQKYASDDTEGIAKDMKLFEKHLKTPEAKSFVRNYYEEQARQNRSGLSLLKVARYSMADGNFDEAKALAKEAKKLAKKAKEDSAPYKAFLKELKVARKNQA